MTDIDPEYLAKPQHIEYDEYSVIYKSGYQFGGVPVLAIASNDPESAIRQFEMQWAGFDGPLPEILGMQKQHLVKDYGESELVSLPKRA